MTYDPGSCCKKFQCFLPAKSYWKVSLRRKKGQFHWNMDRFEWSNGVLLHGENHVKQQPGIRLYDGPDKVST